MYAFSFIYNTATGEQTSVVLTSHSFSREPKYKYRLTNVNIIRGSTFPRGIYSEVHSPVTTLEIICVMALTLQPMRGCPQYSGETGTQLSSAIHRRLLSRFFLREKERRYTGYQREVSLLIGIPFHIFHYCWGEEYRSLYRGLRYIEVRYIDVPL